jgi:uncharacterized protein with GYD domain
MPHYILLVNWTEQGIKNVKDTTKRAQVARQRAERLGGKFQIFYTLGEYDSVAVAEMPNDETMVQFAMELSSLGNVRTKTLKAWTEDEVARIVAKLS